MNDAELQTRDRIAAAYLEQLHDLASEITTAMDAIATNTLPKFQESVARQEMLCAGLESMAKAVSEGFRTEETAAISGPTLTGIDLSVENKIKATSGAIRDLNLQYAALLKHSGKSIGQLALLCSSFAGQFHAGQFQEARGTRSNRQTWSCEM
jgi:hypothetical protein